MATQPLQPGDPRQVGTYRVLARLGAGGMGTVFVGRSAGGRTVAIKLVHAELARDPEFRRRFRHEVRAARKVGGEFTARVLDADTDAAIPWLATAYIAGPTLREVVDGRIGPLPERSLGTLAAGLGGALRAIHERGLVHRDLKPTNVLLTLDGPRVIDFGIARAMDSSIATPTGAVIGTPAFMSPEQVRGERVAPASDVFSLGSVLAYAATGRLPFATADSGLHALMMRIASAEPDLNGLVGPMRELVESCLAKDPSARPSPQEVIDRAGLTPTSRHWLPGAVMDMLGRHAVALLDQEAPETSGPRTHDRRTALRPPPPSRPPDDPPLDPPTSGSRAVPAPAQTDPLPAVPRLHRSRGLVIAGAVLAPLAVFATVSFAASFRDEDPPASKPSGTRKPGVTTPSITPSTLKASPTSTPKPSPRRTTVPPAFIGTWQGPSTDDETLRFVIRRGKIGSDVVTERFTDRRIQCDLVARLESADDRSISIDARISDPSFLSCKFNTGGQTLTLTDGDTLHFEVENDTVSGTLRRIG
ncbi:serine/threonine-protein kinase [Actinomadura sp. 6N118]|uniref:serine/threonine-protein kinase n=1 Tax=Actinomadura sp. 6N118 TaxID=3375151 RepID=UPI0037A3553C